MSWLVCSTVWSQSESEVSMLEEFYYIIFFALGSTTSVSCVHLVAMHSMSENNNSVAPCHPHFLSWPHCQRQTADLPGEAGCWVPAEGFDRVQSSSLTGGNTSNSRCSKDPPWPFTSLYLKEQQHSLILLSCPPTFLLLHGSEKQCWKNL